MVLLAGAVGGWIATRAGDAGPPERAKRSDTIAIVIAGSADAALERGLTLGTEEAGRMAQLLGFHLDVRWAGAGAVDPVSVDVVILAGDDAPRPPAHIQPTYIDATAGEAFVCLDGVLRILPSAEERSAASTGIAGERVTAWHGSLYRYGAEQLNRRFSDRFGAPMDEAAWSGWFAMKTAVELTLAGETMTSGVRAAGFDGHKGVRLTFDDAGRLRQPLYRIGVAANGDTTAERIDVQALGEEAAPCR